jgi:hypothetical protein
VRSEGLGKFEKIHLIGTRSRDLPACSIVPQPLRYRVPLLQLQFHNVFYTDGKTPWTNDQPDARSLPTHRTTQTQNNAHTDIHALIGIRTHDPSVRASKDSSCLRPRGHCDRQFLCLGPNIALSTLSMFIRIVFSVWTEKNGNEQF